MADVISGALLDTSFLISLASEQRPHHLVARNYFKHALNNGIPLFLSTLVATEFSRKQSILDFGIHNFILLPFNFDEAELAARLSNEIKRDLTDDRCSVAVDLMLIAQAHIGDIAVILTEDEETLAKYCSRLRDSGSIGCHAILLKNGFDPGVFKDPNAPGFAW